MILPDRWNFNCSGNFQFRVSDIYDDTIAKKLLARHRAKRDFTKTAEPSGNAQGQAVEEPPLRDSEACGSQLHYDLELGGVFESWGRHQVAFRRATSSALAPAIGPGQPDMGTIFMVSRSTSLLKEEHHMGLFTKDIQTMEDLFLHQLEDIYYAEQQLIKAIPKMADMPT